MTISKHVLVSVVAKITCLIVVHHSISHNDIYKTAKIDDQNVLPSDNIGPNNNLKYINSQLIVKDKGQYDKQIVQVQQTVQLSL